MRAPDCFSRTVILVSVDGGPPEFQPKLEVTQGDTLDFTLCNNLPDDWPSERHLN